MRINRRLMVVVVVVVAAAVGLLLQSRSSTSGANVAQAITPSEYQAQFLTANAPHLLLDVRTPEEFSGGHIAGAVNIAVETLQSRLNEIPRDQPIVVYCRSGNRSAQAAQILAAAGYTGVRDLGGITAWVAQGLPVQ